LKQKSSKKGIRSGRNKRKGVYEAQRRRTTRNKNNRAIRREKQIKFFKANPDKGSPSQVEARRWKVVPNAWLGLAPEVA